MYCGFEDSKYANLLQQYWTGKGKYQYIPVAHFSEAFRQSQRYQDRLAELQQPYVAPNPKCEEALITHTYALPGVLLSAFPGTARHRADPS